MTTAELEPDAAERWATVQEATSALLDASFDLDTMLDKAAALIVPALADACIVEVFDDALERRAVRHARAERTDALSAIPSGTSLGDTVSATEAAWAEALRPLGLRSFMLLVLEGHEAPIGRILFAREQRSFERADHDVAVQLAERTARLVENALLRRRAEAAVRARDHVLAVVTHDLRGPLTGALLNVDLAARLLDRGDAEGVRRRFDTLRSTLRSIERMATDLLAHSRVALERVVTDGAPLSLRTLVDEVVQLYESVAGARRVALVTDIDPALAIVADRALMQRVVANLVDNAVKHSPPETQVVIAARLVEGGALELSIADAGPGVSRADAERIFELYERGRHEREGGVGLGLAVARQIVEAHGGRLSLDRHAAVGARFIVRLPPHSVRTESWC